MSTELLPTIENVLRHAGFPESWIQHQLGLEAENTRLREALQEMLDNGGTTRGEWMPKATHDKARAALTPATTTQETKS